jgi:hypothetical protein
MGEDGNNTHSDPNNQEHEDYNNDDYDDCYDADLDPCTSQPTISMMVLETVDPPAMLTKAWGLGDDGKPRLVSNYGGTRKPYYFRIAAGYYEPTLATICKLLRELQTEPRKCIVAANPAANVRLEKRELIRRTRYTQADGAEPDLEIGARSWLCADVDGAEFPDLDLTDLPAVVEAARRIMPPDLRGAACVPQFSASHGFKPGVRLHLWYTLDRQYYHDDISAWADVQEDVPGVDWSLLRPVQIHYVAGPVLLNHLTDPCPMRVLDPTDGTPTATLNIPPPAVVATKKRAKHGPSQVDWSAVEAHTTHTTPYGRKALGDSERHVASAMKGAGERHSRLLGFGENIGGLVLGREVALSDMLAAAQRACETNNYTHDYGGPNEVDRVVKDGFSRATPRSAPPFAPRETPTPTAESEGWQGGTQPPPAPPSPTVTATDPKRRWRYVRELYDPKAKARARGRRLLGLARLPPWEVPPGGAPVPTGHGLGYHLNGLIGHGLAPCEIVGVAASSAGSGKTAFVAQLIDGLITRSAMIMRGAPAAEWGSTLTPTILISEMSAEQLTWRSAARWLSVNSQLYRGGLTYIDMLQTDTERAAALDAWDRHDKLTDPPHPFGEALGEWIIHLTAREALDDINRDSDAFAAHLVASMQELVTVIEASRGGIGLPGIVQPVVVLDPVQRSQQGDLTDVEALNKLARVLREFALREGWIVILTSDTNKTTAIGQSRRETTAVEEATAAFRGSYGLIHELTAAWYLRRPPTARDLKSTGDGGVAQYEVEIVLAKNRWGKIPTGTPDDAWPRFYWQPEFLRFIPMGVDEAKTAAWADEEANEKARQHRQAQRAEAQRTAASVQDQIEPPPPPPDEPPPGAELDDEDAAEDAEQEEVREEELPKEPTPEIGENGGPDYGV